MSVELTLVGHDLYTGKAERPTGVTWSASTPMSAAAIIEALNQLGFHPTDITQAFYDADPSWRADNSGSADEPSSP